MTIYEYNVRNQYGTLPETVLSMHFLQIKENFLNSVHVFPDNVTSRGCIKLEPQVIELNILVALCTLLT